jgi:homoserine dehydrogenase
MGLVIAQLKRAGEGIQASVGPGAIPANVPLAVVSGAAIAIAYVTASWAR